MGLDMYIYKKKHYSEYTRKEKFEKIKKEINENIDSFETSKEVAYWRKANQIHNWFSKHSIDGELENCEELKIGKDILKKLIEDCKEALKSKTKAKEIMPTQDGFFFGSTDYDDFYKQDLEDTIKMCTKILDEWDEGADYFYHAWW